MRLEGDSTAMETVSIGPFARASRFLHGLKGHDSGCLTGCLRHAIAAMRAGLAFPIAQTPAEGSSMPALLERKVV
jgi:hypothetical protein